MDGVERVADLKREEGARVREGEALGTLRSYLASAFANSPKMRASYEEWRAALNDRLRRESFPSWSSRHGPIRAVDTCGSSAASTRRHAMVPLAKPIERRS